MKREHKAARTLGIIMGELSVMSVSNFHLHSKTDDFPLWVVDEFAFSLHKSDKIISIVVCHSHHL